MTALTDAPRRRLRRLALAGSIALPVALAGLSAAAHSGHGEMPVPVIGSAVPRLEAASEDFELVALAQGGELIVYLDRYVGNTPVTDAALDVGADGTVVSARHEGEGVYRVAAEWLHHAGSHDVTFTITTPESADLLIGSIAILETPPAAAPQAPILAQGIPAFPTTFPWPTTAAGFGLGLLTALAVLGAGRRRRLAAALAIILVVLLAGGAAFAHGGEDHGAAPAPVAVAVPGSGSFLAETPRRLADGSLFVPKASQRLLTVRTVLTRTEEAAQTVSIIGRVIPDPNSSGSVQASQSGRIEPGDQGLPFLGQRVTAGQVLAYVAPSVTNLERGGLQQQIALLDKEIALAQAQHERVNRLAGTVPQRQIDDARMALAGLQRQRAALVPSLAQREPLVASASGIISLASAVAGRLVDAREVLFEIVDPNRLWVEAVAFDPGLTATIQGAGARTAEGAALTLAYLGRGLTLRQQAIPLQFRIENNPENISPQNLSVGQPVTVIVQTRASQEGIVVPQGSIVRAAGGQPLIWEHISAERFVPRPVRTQPLDGARVLVLAGLEPGRRIVTEGATLLNQVR